MLYIKILLSVIVFFYIYDFCKELFIYGYANKRYARKMCELQKQEIVKKYESRTKYDREVRTVILNTKNVVDLEE